MKKNVVFFVSVLALSILVVFASCDSVDEVVEAPEYESTFSFYVDNKSNSDATVCVKLMIRQTGIVSWCVDDRSEQTIETGKQATFSFTDTIMDHAFEREWSFLIDVDGKMYLGFPKTDKRTEMGLYSTKIQTDNLHSIKISGTTTEPIFSGSIEPKEKTGIEDGKMYKSVSENFTITIGDSVDITLDKAKF